MSSEGTGTGGGIDDVDAEDAAAEAERYEALAIELVPGVALFPSWTAFVAMLRARPEEGH
jgi:hypothetical protein